MLLSHETHRLPNFYRCSEPQYPNVDPRIKPGQTIDLYTKFAVIKVTSIEKKALRDLTEKDAEAQGGYSLNEFKTFWKQSHTVWNPKLKVFVLTFQVDKLVKGGKVK